MLPKHSQKLVIVCALGLICLGLLWELWLAPLRPANRASTSVFGQTLAWLPASWLLSLKVLPICLALPAFIRGNIRAFQWWSMVILLYLTEGLVRATSDRGLSAQLGWLEVAFATVAFLAILSFVRESRVLEAVRHA